jgi:2-iminobutanoate/2-iminopropanoate deaminase
MSNRFTSNPSIFDYEGGFSMKTGLLVSALLLSCAAAMAAPQTAAAPSSGDSDRKYIVAPERKGRPFSDAVLVGNTLYIAGHIGMDPKTGKPGATPEEEAKLVMDGVKHTVESAGMTMDDVVSVQVFCSDVSLYDTFNQVYRGYFKGDFPARAFLGSGKLLFGARYEVLGIAVKRGK